MSQLFDQDSNESQEQSAELSPEQAMELLVGEGKKYATPAELAKAYAHANQHIGKLEEDLQTYRAKAESAKTVEEILAQLKGEAVNENTPPNTPVVDGDSETPDISELVNKAVEQRLQQDTAKTNTQQVIDALKASFGDKAREVYESKEKAYGIDLDALAATSPQAALAILGVAGQQQSASAPSLRGNTTVAEGAAPREGTDAYYEHLHSKGQISREQKFRMKHEALSKYGSEHFFSQRTKS